MYDKLLYFNSSREPRRAQLNKREIEKRKEGRV